MFGFTRRAADTAATFPLAARQMLETVRHHPGGGDWYTPQHALLAQKWQWYAGEQYDDCRYDWSGAPFKAGGSSFGGSGLLSKALVPRADGVPPGFHSMNVPKLSERRPCSPQKTITRVVDRFTALLFGEDVHPSTRCIGDKKTSYWQQSLISTGRLWARMMQARAIGGAEGAVGVGLRAVAGEPRVEIFDPRFTKQIWADREALILRAIDVRYQIPVFVKRKGGDRETAYYWQRRLVSDEGDIRYKPVWVDRREGMKLEDGVEVYANEDGREPRWADLIDQEQSVRHDLGFCPVVWIQNLPNHTSEIGYPDCEGLYPQAFKLDQLGSQIDSAILDNLDPTLVITSPEGVFPEKLKKGSKNGLGLMQGSTAEYLEAAFGSVSVAIQWFEKRQDLFFKEAECLELAQQGAQGGPPTAYEIRKKEGPQQSKTAVLREQYGQHGVRRFLEMAEKMERALASTPSGGFTKLEPRIVKGEGGAEDSVEEVELGPGGYTEVKWPPLARPSAEETTAASTAASTALQGGVVDDQTAVEYAAPYFGAEDPGAVLARIRKAKEDAKKEQQEQMLGGFGGQQPPPSGAE